MAWGFKSGHAISLDEQTYQDMHSKSTKNFFRFADPVMAAFLLKPFDDDMLVATVRRATAGG